MIHFATTNRNKLKEFEQILQMKLKEARIDLDEIQDIEVEKVVEHKAKKAFGKIKKPVIVEDTGLFLKELNGLPGALIKLFEERLSYNQICGLLKKNRKASAKTCIGYCDKTQFKCFTGLIQGEISLTPKGSNGFGWDKIFIPKGHTKTFAQMKQEEKNRLSMRRKALEEFKAWKTC